MQRTLRTLTCRRRCSAKSARRLRWLMPRTKGDDWLVEGAKEEERASINRTTCTPRSVLLLNQVIYYGAQCMISDRGFFVSWPTIFRIWFSVLRCMLNSARLYRLICCLSALSMSPACFWTPWLATQRGERCMRRTGPAPCCHGTCTKRSSKPRTRTKSSL